MKNGRFAAKQAAHHEARARRIERAQARKATKTCPMCGREYSDAPALSRRKGFGEICPNCGTREAIEDYIVASGK